MVWSLCAAGVLFVLLSVMLAAIGLSRGSAASIGVVAAASALAFQVVTARRPTLVAAAMQVERTAASDNLIVTAAELLERPRPVRADIQDAIVAQARERVERLQARRVIPLAQPVAVLIAVAIGVVLVAAMPATQPIRGAAGAASVVAGDAPGFVVRITPPAYTHRTPETFQQPAQITVLQGSEVRVESGTTVIREWRAVESTGMEVNVAGAPTRFLSVVVVPDAAPALRIVAPGKDTAFAEPKGRVAIGVEARDDLGLASLTIRFTKASGGGENVTFAEGELPLRVERADDRHWQGRTELVLDALNLADGDVLVYRAVGRDTNPLGVAVQSEPYLVEIGKNAVFADAGFALPAEERKYAISQQMVIYKTEQLLARGRIPDLLEQAQGIAVEQRMVRAEVVFLGGGEVEDELEEAANSNELTEGRLQNTGRVEMLRAINAMSRAEAQLNEGRLPEALAFEKQALASLERALDRRRYFLRTLPDRSRIDSSRRLTGERKDARSWSVDPVTAAASSAIDRSRAVMQELTLAATRSATDDAALAARISAIDPRSADLQSAAVALASAATGDARQAALRSAMQAVTTQVLRSLPGSTTVAMPNRALDGRLSDELGAGGKRQ